MAYRIVEITKPAECHVINSQLEITLEEGTVNIPLFPNQRHSSLLKKQIFWADDLLEPWCAKVDQIAYGIIGTDCNLSIKQRRTLTGVLHKSCKIEGKVMNISTGIELMVDSFKNAVIENQAEV